MNKYKNIIKFMKNLIKFIFTILIIATSFNVKADANPDLWPNIKERMFQDSEIIEAEFIQIDGPKRAASGAQVPVNIKLTKTEGINLEKIHLIIDANPTQHAATYHLTDKTQNLDLFTRIRMETDSFVRIVAQDTDGNLYMNKVAIRASGGCSGYMDVHDPSLTKDLGKVLVKTKKNFITTRIKHPNFTGLQKDQESGGYIPEWIVKQIRYDFNGERILAVENDISISQDPYLKFKFVAGDQGTLTVSATDTKGQIFLKSKKI